MIEWGSKDKFYLPIQKGERRFFMLIPLWGCGVFIVIGELWQFFGKRTVGFKLIDFVYPIKNI